jgi:type IV pilus assembly protein PilE
MFVDPARVDRSHLQRGFTLIEIMIAVVIVAILASVALPSFLDSIRKSRRTDAFNAIANVQQAQERWRSNKSSYASDSQLTALPTADPPGLGVPARTAKGYYDLELSDTGAAGYTVTATAVSGTSQANDTRCLLIGARVAAGGNLTYGSGSSSIDWADPNRCWAR